MRACIYICFCSRTRHSYPILSALTYIHSLGVQVVWELQKRGQKHSRFIRSALRSPMLLRRLVGVLFRTYICFIHNHSARTIIPQVSVNDMSLNIVLLSSAQFVILFAFPNPFGYGRVLFTALIVATDQLKSKHCIDMRLSWHLPHSFRHWKYRPSDRAREIIVLLMLLLNAPTHAGGRSVLYPCLSLQVHIL